MSGQSRSIHLNAAALLNAQCTFISFQLGEYGGKRDTIYKNNRAAMMMKTTMTTTTTTKTSKSTINQTKYIFEKEKNKSRKQPIIVFSSLSFSCALFRTEKKNKYGF